MFVVHACIITTKVTQIQYCHSYIMERRQRGIRSRREKYKKEKEKEEEEINKKKKEEKRLEKKKLGIGEQKIDTQSKCTMQCECSSELLQEM